MEIVPKSVTVSLTDPLGFLAIVHREEDGSNKPCIFRWSLSADAWGPSGFMLFQHTADGLKKVEGKHRPPPPETLELTGRDVEFEELLPGQCIKRNLCDLPPFWDQLVEGVKYELLWPGAEYALWDWGTFREHLGQEIGTNLGLPRVIIPGGARCTLAVIESHVFPRTPSPSPVRKSERITGAPCLSVSLEGPSEMILGERLTVTMKVTYDGLTCEDGETVLAEATPIIIQKLPFSFLNFRLHRRDHNYDMWDSDDDAPEWEAYHDDQWNILGINVEGPDIEVNVTDDKLFLSLQPGESWHKRIILGLNELHPDTAVGDSYRFQYWGGRVKWWVWGSRQEHANTVVRVPPWMGSDVVDPADNEGKPHIIIPESNRVEFAILKNTVA
ncbi:unnamed protein product [Penicillium nalgiovense]|uniref:Uncharacterized protein n=1 Tax=Penicillium nalgiovense TaxID=60175 RepID=A0A9W4MRL3_PENNA|nr:unnamed protein product [Penicillium nalgiovense]CAG8057418.1 unnamed protein product [Penicillium nalgiovense]CAG8065403.1 unnamed protein product [Penicillium nalgiovense]CAG8065917.1 unnamed protein product [Penicillium nalgiovense]CAG8078370.1 unnamed protein product [Penicillium nalgiovense]